MCSPAGTVPAVPAAAFLRGSGTSDSSAGNSGVPGSGASVSSAGSSGVPGSGMVQLRGGLLHRYLLTLLVVLGARHVGAYPWEARGLGRQAGKGQHPALAVCTALVVVGPGCVRRSQLQWQREAWGCGALRGRFPRSGGATSRTES